jgi:hypothetical protein
MSPTLALILIGAVAVGLFAWSAEKGVGLPYRLVQYVYYSWGSLEGYRKAGHDGRTLVDLIGSQSPTLGDRLVRRVAPSQEGWFAARFPTDKGTYHDYAAHYDALFAPYRGVEGVRLLEVGVKKGGSMVLWREFFSPSAHIYGIDVHPGVPRFSEDDQMTVLILDSRDEAAMSRALEGLSFDIIVDDGLHHPDAQRQTYSVLRPYLKPTGVYVIEDVYALEADTIPDFGDQLTVLPDRTGQELYVLQPEGSLAPRINGRPPQ